MPHTRSTKLQRLLAVLAAILIVKVTLVVMWGYRNYFPPNFNSEFLHGREDYFSSSYRWAFYTHIASGPLSLFLGLALIGERFRLRAPKLHRLLGRIQVPTILFLVAPSGLWMARHVAAGPIAALGFAMLAILTALCAAFGWRAAVQRRFAVHRLWMWRTFLLLCSAVVIRLLGGLATVVGVQSPWFDPLASWVCWTVPLAAFELSCLKSQRTGGSTAYPFPTIGTQ